MLPNKVRRGFREEVIVEFGLGMSRINLHLCSSWDFAKHFDHRRLS